ncbi:hypothetical protein HMPREF1544_10592 [Mucor circinelloides 1006PhL]|uniref:Peptidase A1 domain-containing protein n=1 Tax=Mucor circinelloides f. circinelloides (strain 1006PhL) TaxID=1220926 RepID=S2IZG3_MUCC1|nr:hypothetical protein HMPREF1544_10592 [Mucor circinelloides 1006PhL]
MVTASSEPIHVPLKRLQKAPATFNALLSKRLTNNVSVYNDLGQAYLAEIIAIVVNAKKIVQIQCNSIIHIRKTRSSIQLLLPGNFSGIYAKDTLSLGGIVVQEQQFALVDHIEKSMLANDYKLSKKCANEIVSTQGMLGLGHKSMVQVPSENASDLYDPLIYAMTKQSLIPEQIFSFYTNSVLSEGWVGELTLGSVNVDRYTGDVGYAAVPAISMDGNDSTPSEHTLWQDIKYILIDTETSLSYIGGLYSAQIVSAITPEIQPDLDTSTGCHVVDWGLKNSTKYVEIGLFRFANGTNDTLRVSIPVRNLVQLQHVGKSMMAKDGTCIFNLCSWPSSDK